MEFLQTLSEARLFGGSRTGLSRYNAKEIADLLFLHLIALQILKNDFYGLPKAQDYVRNSGNLVTWDDWSSARNEIYVMLHVLFGKRAEKARLTLKDQEESQEFLKHININWPYLRKFLRLVLSGQSDEAFERRFLLDLEHDLKINNSYYRSLRRLASTWNQQSESNKRLVMTRLLQILRTKARRSELLPVLEWVSRQEKLEDKTLDPLTGEPTFGAKQPVKPEKTSFLKHLGYGIAGAAAGAAAGYGMTRKKK